MTDTKLRVREVVYSGTMTVDNMAGKISARIWPAYLMAKYDERGGPTVIAFCQELYTEAIKLMKNRQYNTKDGKPKKDEMLCMKIVYDENLPEGGWELRWT